MYRRAFVVGLVALVGVGCEYFEPKKYGLTTAERKQVYLELLREYQRHGVPGPGPWDDEPSKVKTSKQTEELFRKMLLVERIKAEMAISQRTGLSLVDVKMIYQEGRENDWRGVPR